MCSSWRLRDQDDIAYQTDSPKNNTEHAALLSFIREVCNCHVHRRSKEVTRYRQQLYLSRRPGAETFDDSWQES